MSKYTYAKGKRKTSSAQICIFEGNGESMINGKKITEYITRADLFEVVYEPLKLCKVKDSFYFHIKVSGSGVSGQAQAIRHGIARGLAEKDE